MNISIAHPINHFILWSFRNRWPITVVIIDITTRFAFHQEPQNVIIGLGKASDLISYIFFSFGQTVEFMRREEFVDVNIFLQPNMIIMACSSNKMQPSIHVYR